MSEEASYQMIFVLESKMLLKTLHLFIVFCCGLYIFLTVCAKSKGKAGASNGKRNGKRDRTTNDKTKNETEDSVKFNINVRPVEKRDEFDDDEENPLAKIPTRPRPPNQKARNASTTSRTSSTATTGSRLEPEASFFAPHENQTGASCYMVKTANQG